MSKPTYHKNALTFEEQLKQLKERGLSFNNEEKAKHLLEVISYYRLSGYWYPLLQDKKEHLFKSGAQFEKAFNLYKFDRELRQMLLNEIEKIEVAVRSKMIYELSHEYGPFWFQDSSLFKNSYRHSITISKIGDELQRSDEEFIIEFYEKYSDEFPPSWITLEITSFGALSMLYSNLKVKKREVANYFGLSERTFQSWLHTLVYVRNVCAHHSRLWNKEIRISPSKPKKTKSLWLQDLDVRNDKVFYLLSMIIYLLNTINPKHSFSERFNNLLLRYPDSFPGAMGFQNNWKEEPLWKREGMEVKGMRNEIQKGTENNAPQQ